jgi:hypothetical protein
VLADKRENSQSEDVPLGIHGVYLPDEAFNLLTRFFSLLGVELLSRVRSGDLSFGDDLRLSVGLLANVFALLVGERLGGLLRNVVDGALIRLDEPVDDEGIRTLPFKRLKYLEALALSLPVCEELGVACCWGGGAGVGV